MKHHVLKKKLAAKGWHETDIARVIASLLHAHHHSHPALSTVEKLLAWIALGFSILINFIVSIAMIPVYLSMPPFIVMLCLIFFGLCFGLLMDLLIREIDSFSRHHYVAAGLFLPMVSLITMYMTVRASIFISRYFQSTKLQDPVLLALVYTASFLLPHFLYKYFELRERDVYGY